MQAAWVLGKREHEVVVYEKENTAGGQYRLASVPTMKQDLSKTILTYLTLCKKYNVKIIYGVEVTKEILDKENYNEIIIATGSLPIVPPIEGINGKNVVLANQILSFDKIFADKNILVLGAGLVGAETAELLAEYNNSVIIVDMIDKVAPIAPARPRGNLLDHLKQLNVNIMLNRKVLKINEDGIVCEYEGKALELSGYDVIVLAFGSRSNIQLYNTFNSEYNNVHLIGDAAKAGDAKKAIFEATKLALKL